MSDHGRRPRRNSPEPDSPNSRTECCPEPGCLEEDKEIASQAVLFVINGARKGAVHLCSSIAELLRENRRLQRIVEAQRAVIEQLRSATPVVRGPASPGGAQTRAPHTPSSSSSHSSPSLYLSTSQAAVLCLSVAFSVTLPQDTSVSSSPTSRRSSLSPGARPPSLPPLASPQPSDLTLHRKVTADHVQVAMHQMECPRLPTPLVDPCSSSPHFRRRDSRTRHSEARKSEGSTKEQYSPDSDALTSGKKHKRKEKHVSGDVTEEPGAERMPADPGEDQRGSPPHPRASERPDSTVLNRKKHRLKLNDRVVLDRKQKGAVRYIGRLETAASSEVFIGVELDTACGDNDGTLSGRRYFKCKPSHGTFVTISQIKKLSKPTGSCDDRDSHANRPDSSDSEGGGSSAPRKSPKNRLRRTRNLMDINALVHCDPEPRGSRAGREGVS
ncbi:CAP-Gly domain-containing linker protein 2-like [Megalops cyprinoides]|uniref:CAP-Gly domain-containing linker protein 2-like n=1 Tax=Megalops cyprinoides TaxID=118141 RepID=UPI0018652A95|nr:CAP-Gly domain-containing linker protein 2-like [Megalops cyprinoides]